MLHGRGDGRDFLLRVDLQMKMREKVRKIAFIHMRQANATGRNAHQMFATSTRRPLPAVVFRISQPRRERYAFPIVQQQEPEPIDQDLPDALGRRGLIYTRSRFQRQSRNPSVLAIPILAGSLRPVALGQEAGKNVGVEVQNAVSSGMALKASRCRRFARDADRIL